MKLQYLIYIQEIVCEIQLSGEEHITPHHNYHDELEH
jgi:hypothetical protein